MNVYHILCIQKVIKLTGMYVVCKTVFSVITSVTVFAASDTHSSMNIALPKNLHVRSMVVGYVFITQPSSICVTHTHTDGWEI